MSAARPGGGTAPQLPTPLTGCCAQLCKSCFFDQFEQEVHTTITNNKLFARGDRVAIGASGETLVCSYSEEQQSAAGPQSSA